MNDTYDKLEAFINKLDGAYTDAEARAALPILVSALKNEDVMASGGEIVAICELVLQVCLNGINEMDSKDRNRFFPHDEVSRQAFRI